jgi:hypothetical protein
MELSSRSLKTSILVRTRPKAEPDSFLSSPRKARDGDFARITSTFLKWHHAGGSSEDAGIAGALGGLASSLVVAKLRPWVTWLSSLGAFQVGLDEGMVRSLFRSSVFLGE